jgi:hypothetical protein
LDISTSLVGANRLMREAAKSHSSSMRKFNPPPALLRCRVLLKTKTTGLGVSPRKGERGRLFRNSSSCRSTNINRGWNGWSRPSSFIGRWRQKCRLDCMAGSKPSAKSGRCRNSSYEIRIPRASHAKAKDVADSSKSLDTPKKSSVSSKSLYDRAMQIEWNHGATHRRAPPAASAVAPI